MKKSMATLIPAKLKQRFTELCRARKYTKSEIVEKLIKIYVDEADANGWTEYIETKCISCHKTFTQEKLKQKRWCCPECHLLAATFRY